MTPDRYQRVKEVFQAVCELPAAERGPFLASACAGDGALRAEVETLLAHDDDSAALPARLPQPAQIGRYRILGLLGEGGMAVVYRAEQDNPRRAVALKVIKPGIVSRAMLRRFEHEAQVLGRLQHPGIAQIFEAGTCDWGHGLEPFFALELIDGRRLTDYVEGNRLNTRQRLEALTKVCDAVQHAHQKGVIHRDLKPGNILVDAAGQPKVLDFGVARVTDSDLQTTTLRTDVGQLIGTVPYMSPEQVSGDPNELDTRSDVYSLGVIGYELLTGRLPYEVRDKALPEAVRVIRDTEAAPLSAVNKVFRGDLETIFSRALEKDKSRRYPSASALAADIGRYLRDEPIVARPASAGYQMRKFARRHRALVGGVAAVFVALVAGVIGTSVGLLRAVAAEELARQRLAQATAARDAVQKEADRAKAANDFLRTMLTAVDPERAGREAKVVDLLRSASAEIERTVAGQPELEAALRDTIGTAYHALGLYDDAEPNLTQALEIRQRLYGEDRRETIESMNNMAALRYRQGRWSDAADLARRALAAGTRVLGAEHEQTLECTNNLAAALHAQGRLGEAETLHRQVLETQVRRLGEEHPDVLISMNNLAWVLKLQGKIAEAESLYRQTVAVESRVLGTDNVKTLAALGNLAALLYEQGQLSEAESLANQVLDARRSVLGEEHPDTLTAMNALAAIVRAEGRRAEAEALLWTVLEGRRRRLGAEHPETLVAMNNLAVLLKTAGKLDEAEPLYRDAFEIQVRTLGAEHPMTLQSMNNLAALLSAQGKPGEAETLLRRTLALRRRALGTEHPDTLQSLCNLANLLLSRGRPLEAEPLFAEAVDAAQRTLPPGDARQVAFQTDYAICLTRLERYADAEARLLAAYAAVGTADRAAKAARAKIIRSLGELYEAWGRPDRAAEWRAKLPATQPANP